MTAPVKTRSRRDLWLLAFRQRSLWLRALKFGFTAGMLQALVNQGDVWYRHAASTGVIMKTIASPLIGLTLVFLTSAGTWVQDHEEMNVNYER